uniref:Transcriptional regulator n=1 Tax=Bacterium symbiont subsp. Theonella swinhoei (strain pTSMAC1) TaxID=1221190 RepID=J9ZXF9_BACS1|nr:transcriptional regulator [bacterium symbiont of Theonella swinhoei pTSMAC1]
MPHLEISLLGTLSLTLDSQPLSHIESDKGRALLAYLAMESDRPHRRETLAGLLWPDHADRAGRQNLRRMLYNLRRVLAGDQDPNAFLSASHQDIQFNPASDHRLDVRLLTDAFDACESHAHLSVDTCKFCVERLETATALYKGELN